LHSPPHPQAGNLICNSQSKIPSHRHILFFHLGYPVRDAALSFFFWSSPPVSPKWRVLLRSLFSTMQKRNYPPFFRWQIQGRGKCLPLETTRFGQFLSPPFPRQNPFPLSGAGLFYSFFFSELCGDRGLASTSGSITFSQWLKTSPFPAAFSMVLPAFFFPSAVYKNFPPFSGKQVKHHSLRKGRVGLPFLFFSFPPLRSHSPPS